MTHLSKVWLNNNHFTCLIPDFLSCTTMFDLQLQNNYLTEEVPPSLMSLPSLKNVSLDYNKLDGLVPSIGKGVKATFDYNSFCQPYDSRVTILLDIASDFGYPLNLVFD